MPTANPNVFSPYNAFLPGTSRFTSDQAVADLDWNVERKGHCRGQVLLPARSQQLALRLLQRAGIYGAHGYRLAGGFAQQRRDHSASTLSISETVGVLREKAYATNDQAFAPTSVGMSSAFGNYFPGITINDAIGDAYDSLLPARSTASLRLRFPSVPTPNTRRRIPASSRTASCPRAQPSGQRAATLSASAAVGRTRS